METAPPSAAAWQDSSAAPTRLWFMCSYGGCILPCPTNHVLRYLGGETRIVAADRVGGVAGLRARLALAFSLGRRPFGLKYQLPSEPLDSLDPLAADADLAALAAEHDRLLLAADPAKPYRRLRLFLFPLDDSKAESLRGDVLPHHHAHQVFDVQFIPDSMLETPSSSSGSTYSSFSLSNLSPIRVRPDNHPTDEHLPAYQTQEEGIKEEELVQTPRPAYYQDEASGTMSLPSGSTSSLFSLSSLPPIRMHPEDRPADDEHLARMTLSSATVVPAVETRGEDIKEGDFIEMTQQKLNPLHCTFSKTIIRPTYCQNKLELKQGIPISDPSYQIPMQSDQHIYHHHHHHQQQYIHAKQHYIPRPQAGSTIYVPAYYQMLHPVGQLQQQSPPYNTQPTPVYFLPVQQIPSHNLAMQPIYGEPTSISSLGKPGMPLSNPALPQHGEECSVVPVEPKLPAMQPDRLTPLIHVTTDRADPRTCMGYHLLHPYPLQYAYEVAALAGSQGYHTKTSFDPQYQMGNCSMLM